ncbi:MAG: DMT family transporter, partial [Chloroflexi bacterium]|nr:DMT family transporter [Chloroflexota bacterium]
MQPSLLGELASLATAILWTGSATFFTVASRRLGSVVLNRTRLLLAVIFLLITHTLLLGSPLPLDASPDRWLWLGLSGVIGLAIGDAMLFQAYVLIGARMGLLMLSTAPLISTLLAWALLGEQLLPIEWLGVLLTIAGIAWVVTRGSGPLLDRHQPHYVQGIVLGLGAAVCQAAGYTLSKLGLGGDFPALSGVVIRMLAGFVALWGWTLVRGEVGETFARLSQDRGALRPAVAGAIVGPFLGVWMSLIGVQLARVGVASTIMALPPVFSLPVSRFILKE